jgi:membrane-associated phospholipid phosphatase
MGVPTHLAGVAPLPINVLLIASTVMLGAHYAVDLLASGLMLASSLALYRWTRGLRERDAR